MQAQPTMADPLSVTGTAVGIISLGIQVCSGLIQYSNTWKDFDADVNATCEAINDLSRTFSLVSNKLKSNIFEHRPAASQALESIKLCESGILALEKQPLKIKAKEPSATATRGQAAVAVLKKQGKRLLYPFRQNSIIKLRDTVGELRDNLAPVLLVLNLDIGEESLLEMKSTRAEN